MKVVLSVMFWSGELARQISKAYDYVADWWENL